MHKSVIRGIIAGIAVTAVATVLAGCAEWNRFQKNLNSSWNNGLNRTVEVYDVSGEKIKEYSGKFDIIFDEDTGRILFDVENGKRHLIFPGTSTVLVDEI